VRERALASKSEREPMMRREKEAAVYRIVSWFSNVKRAVERTLVEDLALSRKIERQIHVITI